MMSSHEERLAVQRAAELEQPLMNLERSLTVLALALHQQDPEGIARSAADLHLALAAAAGWQVRRRRAAPG